MNSATADDPPSSLMMSETVITKDYNENRNVRKSKIAECVIYASEGLGQLSGMLTTAELLAQLEARGIKNADVAKTIGVSPSRIAEMFKGERSLKLDEAAKLCARFELESPPVQPKVSPVPARVARLVVLHVAATLGVSLADREQEIAELSEDVRAFAEYVADPGVRDSVELAEAFFHAMRLRRPVSEAEDPPRNGHQPA